MEDFRVRLVALTMHDMKELVTKYAALFESDQERSQFMLNAVNSFYAYLLSHANLDNGRSEDDMFENVLENLKDAYQNFKQKNKLND